MGSWDRGNKKKFVVRGMETRGEKLKAALSLVQGGFGLRVSDQNSRRVKGAGAVVVSTSPQEHRTHAGEQYVLFLLFINTYFVYCRTLGGAAAMRTGHVQHGNRKRIGCGHVVTPRTQVLQPLPDAPPHDCCNPDGRKTISR